MAIRLGRKWALCLGAGVTTLFWLANGFAGAEEQPADGVDQKALKEAVEKAHKNAGNRFGIGGTNDEAMKAFQTRLRELYPFVSVAPRLAFEAEGRKRLATAGGRPALNEESRDELTKLEARPGIDYWGRVNALRTLHEETIREFTDASGFGMRRIPIMPIFQGWDIAPKTVSLEKTSANWSEDDVGVAAQIPATGGLKSGEAPGWPSREVLRGFHRRGQEDFASPEYWGLVRDQDKVAGFLSHQLSHLPKLQAPAPEVGVPNKKPVVEREPWVIARLELVSLLTHETPMVYVSDHLPAMSELKKAETRQLTLFEDEAVKSLVKGENLVTDATTNRIRMAGAIRATGACLKCHDAKRGDLLGAFTYELRRDPLVKEVAK